MSGHKLADIGQIRVRPVRSRGATWSRGDRAPGAPRPGAAAAPYASTCIEAFLYCDGLQPRCS